MKQLVWKELREQRFVPVVSPILLCLLVFSYYTYSQWEATHTGRFQDRLTVEATPTLLAIVTILFGFIVGCSTIASEVGNGTLRFLTMLPSGRRKVWLSKIAGGLLIIASAAVLCVLTLAVADIIIYGTAGAHFAVGLLWNYWTAYQGSVGVVIIGVLWAYALALFVSALVDCPISAIVLSIVLSIAFFITFQLLADEYGAHQEAVLKTLFLGATLAFLSTSYAIFVHGETLLTAKRLHIAVIVIFVWMIIGGGYLIAMRPPPPVVY